MYYVWGKCISKKTNKVIGFGRSVKGFTTVEEAREHEASVFMDDEGVRFEKTSGQKNPYAVQMLKLRLSNGLNATGV